MLERGGNVMTKVVPDVKKRTLQPIVTENVKAGSTISTDELRSYRGLDKHGYQHQTVNHGAGQYVNGDAHVNSLEGFWAHLEKSSHATHIHVSRQHLQTYTKEFEYRFNSRQNPERMFPELISTYPAGQ